MTIYAIAGSPPVFSPFPKRGTCGCNDGCNCNASQAANPALDSTQANKQSNPQQSLSEDEQQQVKELAARDREVKAHEAAHKAAGAGLTGPASYSFTTGPDGKRYATGGEVSVDTSTIAGDPQATLMKANRIRAAALAPAEPSSQDLQVAAQAAQMAAAARMEQATQKPANADNSKENVKDESLSNTPAKHQYMYEQIASINNKANKGNWLDYTV